MCLNKAQEAERPDSGRNHKGRSVSVSQVGTYYIIIRQSTIWHLHQDQGLMNIQHATIAFEVFGQTNSLESRPL